MKRKVAIGLVLLLAGMFLFVACGQAAEPAENSPDETETGNRDVWISLWGIEEKLELSSNTEVSFRASTLRFSSGLSSVAPPWDEETIVSEIDSRSSLQSPYILFPSNSPLLIVFSGNGAYVNGSYIHSEWPDFDEFLTALTEAGACEIREAIEIQKNDPQGWIAVRDSLRDLQSRIGDFNTLNVDVRSVEPVTWNDGSLGAPEPGMMYTQALVEGHRVIFELDDVIYEYHTSPQHVVLASQTTEDGEI